MDEIKRFVKKQVEYLKSQPMSNDFNKGYVFGAMDAFNSVQDKMLEEEENED